MKKIISFVLLCGLGIMAQAETYIKLYLTDGQVVNSCLLLNYTSDSLCVLGHEIQKIYRESKHSYIPNDISKIIVLSSNDHINQIHLVNNQFLSNAEYKQYKKQIKESNKPTPQEEYVEEPQASEIATTTTARNTKSTASTKKVAPYHESFGINVGNRLGLSYKIRKKSFGFILDVDWQVDNTIVQGSKGWYGWDFGISPNFVGHKTLNVSNNGNLSWYGGGGLEIGIAELFPQSDGQKTPKYTATKDILAKIGVHFITGAEYAFTKIPLCLSADFRPGVGYYAGIGNGTGVQSTLGLDWSLGLSIRYYW